MTYIVHIAFIELCYGNWYVKSGLVRDQLHNVFKCVSLSLLVY